MGWARIRMFSLVVGFLVLTPVAFAVIQAVLPLRDCVKQADYLFIAKVEAYYPDKPAMVLKVEEQLRGKAPFEKIPVNLKGDAEAEKLQHVPQLLKRLGLDLPLVFFVSKTAKAGDYTALVFTNGTWMQFSGSKAGSDTPVWRLTHGEPYLRRTFKGTTAELRQVLVEAVAGKRRLPDYNEKETPGFGPELEKK